jgi:hypothetical protein
MEKKNILGLGVLFVILLVLGAVALNIYLDLRKDPIQEEDITEDSNTEACYDNISFDYYYKGNNLWQYNVTGTLPNPCYTISVESVVMESYPEQVIVKSTITKPDPETMCIQVIQEVEEEGEFEASEQATVTFEME